MSRGRWAFRKREGAVLTIRAYHDKSGWNSILSCFAEYDYVHTYDFHKISENNGEGIPILFVVQNEQNEVLLCWPALKRRVPGTALWDLTSVYGYGGPLLNSRDRIGESLDVLFETMSDMGIVALFSRMHPLFNQDVVEFKPYTEKISDVPIIDMRLQDKTLETYSKDHRRGIRKLERLGAKFLLDNDCEMMEEFKRIYYDSMGNIGARDYFMFDDNYFSGLADASDFKTEISLIKLDDVIICGSLLVTRGNIMHGYLTGTVEEYRSLAPVKLDYAKTHELGIERGLRWNVLGPGRSTENDSLLKFKQGFAKLTFPLAIFKKIIRPGNYRDLCEQYDIDHKKTGFFPAYRYEAKEGV